jgi:hypothetical protein
MRKTIAIMRLSCAAIVFLLFLSGSEGHAQSPDVPKSSSLQAPQQTNKPAATPGGANSSTATRAESVPQWLQVTKVVLETMAYVLAGLFFLFKAYVGYFFDNLSLSLSCRRRSTMPQQAEQAGKDQIVVVVSIKKGDNGMLRLFLLECRVVELKSGEEHTKSFDIRRIGYKRDEVLKLKPQAIQWREERKGYPNLQFPPGDETQFAHLFEVTHGETCKIDVVVMGRSRWPRIKLGQWRASEISLPDNPNSENVQMPAKE